MNSFEITGKIYAIFDRQQPTETFQKREFILEIDDNGYVQYVKFQTVQQRCDLLDQFQPGDQVKVRFSLSGRPYKRPDGEVIYFTNLKVWDIQPLSEEQAGASVEPPDFGDVPPADEDDLPF